MKKLLIILGLALLAFTSCKKESEDPQPEPTGDIIVADITKVVDQSTRDIITSIDTSNFNFTFDGTSNLVSNLQVGDILVDSASALAPYGYLRKVTSISGTKNGETTVTTEMATLTEAIQKGKIDFSTGKLTMAHVSHYELSEGITMKTLKSTDFQVFEMEYEKEFENENGTITIKGYTELDIDFFFNFEWDYEVLAVPPRVFVDLFETGVEINQSASIICTSEAGAGISEEFSLAKFYFTPWTFMVGPIPVVFVPKIELFVTMDGTITAVFTASASESFTGRLGTRYTDSDKWSRIAEKNYESDYVAPNLNANAEFVSHVGPKVGLYLYGIAGPFANVTGCGKVSATLNTGTGNWNLYFLVGVQSEVGVEIDLIGFDKSWKPGQFCLFSDTLLKLNDEPFGNDIFIVSPTEGQNFLVGDQVIISTSFTGETPDEVEFWFDYNLVYTDTEAPFEYVLNTNGQAEGKHVLGITAKINGVEIASDNASFNLEIPVWDVLELSSLGLTGDTDANDLFFINTTDGWMTLAGDNYGKILSTTDAGLTWQETYSTNTTLHKVIMFNNTGEGIFLAGDGRVMYTNNGGSSLEELTYGQWDQPSFQWNDAFDIATNNKGEILAVTKDEGIPYQFQVGRANMASHDPAGYFKLPYPNEYGIAPNIVMKGDTGYLYNVYHEDEPNSSYFMSTTDGGVNWVGFDLPSVDVNTQLNGAHMPDAEHVWIVGGDDNGAVVVMSNNGGSSWTTKSFPELPAFSSVYFTGEYIGYASVKRWTNDLEAKLYKTIDGGLTWNPLIDTRGQYGMSKVFFLGEDFGVLSGRGPYVYRYSVGK